MTSSQLFFGTARCTWCLRQIGIVNCTSGDDGRLRTWISIGGWNDNVRITPSLGMKYAVCRIGDPVKEEVEGGLRFKLDNSGELTPSNSLTGA